MPEIIDLVTSYVPNLILRRFADNPAPQKEASQERFMAAVFFVDISGFTRIAETLGVSGAVGIEKLTEHLNTYFGQMISLIASHGGDIVKFAGDALFAVWYNDTSDMVDAAQRATQCALNLTRTLNDYKVDENLHLSLRVSIGVGEVLAMSVGGVRNRWEFLIAGDPLRDVGTASEIAQPGQVILSPATYQHLEAMVSGTVVDNGYFHAEKVQATPIHALPHIKVHPDAINGLMDFASRAIVQYMIEVGEGGWLAQNRRVTVIFLQIANLDFSDPTTFDQLNTIMRYMQTALYNFEGSVRQLIQDDKGTVFIAALGLPPFVHQDDPLRGIQAAILMHTQLKEMGYQVRIGVTTGYAFCGPVGNTLRHEYAMVGNVVNLSARLMGATKKFKDTPILCDEATYQATYRRIVFEPLEPIPLKNIAEPVKIYRPLNLQAQVEGIMRPLVGRHHERDLLTDYLHKLQHGESHVLTIEGEAGIGKSRLTADLLQQAEALGILHIMGTALVVNKLNPNHVWNDVLKKLFSFDTSVQTTMRRKNIALKVMRDKEIQQSLPLLKGVLNLDLPENDSLAEVPEGSIRLRRTRDLMLKMLQVAAENEPIVLILENAQWMDSASWEFMQGVMQSVSPLLLVIVTRPLDTELTPAQKEFLEEKISHRITLTPLSSEETSSMVRHCLEVTELSPEIEEIIYNQAQGNPFFSEEIAYSMRDSGSIVREGDRYNLKGGPTTQINITIPETLQGILTSRIDALPPAVQLTLKVASVIGTGFTYRVLYDIFPIEPYKERLREYLGVLDNMGLITHPAEAQPDEYVFKQSLTQDVAYNLLPFSQRRDLHEAVARWYERNFIYDLSPYYAFLAHHWLEANHRDQAIKYYEKAGEQLIRTASYQEAIEVFNTALTVGSKTLSLGNNFRLAHWERMIAEAYWGMGALSQTQAHITAALQWLDHSIPPAAERRKAIAREVYRQALHRLFPKRYLGKAENLAFATEAAHIYRMLAEVAYLLNDQSLAHWAGVMALNLGESVGERHPDLARAYANAFIGMSQQRRDGVARIYKRLALSTIEKQNRDTIKAPVLLNLGTYDMVKGQWMSAEGFIERAATLFDKVGDKRGWEDTQYMIGFLSYFKGEFWRGAEVFDGLALSAQRINHTDHRVVGLTGYALHLLALDKLRLATSQMQQAKPLWTHEYVQPVTHFFSQSVFALVTLRSGHYPNARTAADEALALLQDDFRPLAHGVLFGVLALAEVYLTLWELKQSADNLAPALDQLHAALHRLAKHYPAAQPYQILYDGHHAWIQGKSARAHQLWHKAQKASNKLALPYAEAIAHYNIAIHSDNAATRTSHLAQAQTLFESLKAAYYLDRIKVHQKNTPAPPA